MTPGISLHEAWRIAARIDAAMNAEGDRSYTVALVTTEAEDDE